MTMEPFIPDIQDLIDAYTYADGIERAPERRETAKSIAQKYYKDAWQDGYNSAHAPKEDVMKGYRQNPMTGSYTLPAQKDAATGTFKVKELDNSNPLC